MVVVSVLQASQIDDAVKQLDNESRDVLMKYIYRYATPLLLVIHNVSFLKLENSWPTHYQLKWRISLLQGVRSSQRRFFCSSPCMARKGKSCEDIICKHMQQSTLRLSSRCQKIFRLFSRHVGTKLKSHKKSSSSQLYVLSGFQFVRRGLHSSGTHWQEEGVIASGHCTPAEPGRGPSWQDLGGQSRLIFCILVICFSMWYRSLPESFLCEGGRWRDKFCYLPHDSVFGNT